MEQRYVLPSRLALQTQSLNEGAALNFLAVKIVARTVQFMKEQK